MATTTTAIATEPPPARDPLRRVTEAMPAAPVRTEAAPAIAAAGIARQALRARGPPQARPCRSAGAYAGRCGRAAAADAFGRIAARQRPRRARGEASSAAPRLRRPRLRVRLRLRRSGPAIRAEGDGGRGRRRQPALAL